MLALLTFLRVNWIPALWAVSALSFFVAGYWIHGVFIDAAHAKELEAAIAAKQEAEKKSLEISTELEKKLADIRKRNRNLTLKLGKELENRSYITCKLPLSGVRLVNDTIETNASR